MKVTSQIHKTFTTARKRTTINISRKGSIVKEKCRQLTDLVLRYFSTGIIHDDDLTAMIIEYIGADKETIRAYKGYHGHIRAGRCGDNRIVGLSRKGYLEKFGFLKKIGNFKWQVCQLKLLSQDMTMKVKPNEKISLSQNNMAITQEESEKPLVSQYIELEEEEDGEKERNFVHKSLEKLTPLEQTILRISKDPKAAKAEPDKAKVKFPKQKPILEFEAEKERL